MDSTSQIILIIVLGLLLITSSFFSASETALMGLSKIKIRNMEENKVKGVNRIIKLTEDSSKLLTGILVGNNIVNIAASSIATTVFMDIFGQKGVIYATSIMTILVLIFGEIIPKTLANNNPDKVALKVSKFLTIVLTLLSPFVWALEKVKVFVFWIFRIKSNEDQLTITEEELKTLVDVSHEEGILEGEELEIINNVFKLGDKLAKEAMINRLEVSAVEVNTSYQELIEVFKDEKFTRMPVYEDTIDHIVGMLNLKDIIFLSENEINNFKIEDYMREPFFTYEFKKVSALLEEMKAEKVQIAVVVDEYGATAGITTIENLIEEIVGEIEDEYDSEEDVIVEVSHNEYVVDGSMSISDVNDKLGLSLESGDFDSIGGYIIETLEGIPELGEEIEIGNIVLKVEDIDKVKINKVRIIVDELTKVRVED